MRADAAVALGKMDVEESRTAITTLLNDEDSGIQAAVAEAPAPDSVFMAKETLLKLLSSPSAGIRSASALCLSRIGPHIVSEVEPLLADKDDGIRAAALQAVAGFEARQPISASSWRTTRWPFVN